MGSPFRVLVGVVLCSVAAVAAPVPKVKKPPVTLELVADDAKPDLVYLFVTNNTDSPVTWKTTTIPLAAFDIQIADAKGKKLDTTHPSALHSPFAPPGREYAVKPGESYAMPFSVENCFPNGERPAGKLRLTATFKHDGKTYQSEPLEVK
jgi:hypothetical protein